MGADTPPGAAESLRGRLEQLVRAGIRINAERDVDTVLQAVADAAREIINARYAALGILDASGTALARFVTSGLSPEEYARIGQLPEGRGILGLLISEPRPLRLTNLTTHPASYGFPPEHPPMRSFLGVPVVGRQGPIGNLYLTEKIGTLEFSEEDEHLAVTFAAQAAGAVENARLNDEAQRLLGELRAMQTSRDRFYAMMNHELRNALTAVYGWADLLVRRGGGTVPRAAREVYDSAERTLNLLNDLLDLSRLDASRLKPVVRDADAGVLAREAVEMLLPAAHERGVLLETHGGEVEVACRTDPLRVRQILVNLLRNAVQHSPESEIVSLRLRSTPERLRFDVSDRGPGITAEQQAVLFEAFARGNNNERGTGLGLTLSRQLARLLGGDLTVQSRLGHGAVFSLEISRDLRD